ncbi:aminotransferase class I/II-fold pyridoxal phosphate-dependent enzyme [Herbiconiux moechotypicola]|uniref:PLP-dependent aminotransferase family protein n=1 Tax=Herbiconiux moechotypicola TaxID=637393 RepID=A0ABN3DNH6_9MICO|nr:aminotransferase class I/II-fold pyridoxal phosphate-dependent enzyme [Herbiconiux moechotypicola]MCS5730360.1 aminotransferase class I/II-fold pyridoxal phosphate-dependent enzyme [Herbiconiux moechotypicola]
MSTVLGAGSPATAETITSDWIVDRVPGRTSQELGDGLEALIRSGELPIGSQLPTIRRLASAAGVSIGTVLAAWNHLRERGLIETHRRGGTLVTAPEERSTASAAATVWSEIDLQSGAPDIALQPDLRDAVLDSLTASDLNVFGRDFMTSRLQEAVLGTWPFAARSWATAGGGTEALLLATAAAAPPGSVVAVDEPVSPGYLDTLRDLDLSPIGVRGDEHGPTVESLRSALERGAVAFIVQPGAPFAVDHALSPERAADLAALLAAHPGVWVIEDDSIGPLAEAEPPTLGTALPDRVLRVRSYCKAYGIDVRTSVLGGSVELVERSIRLRSHGVGSNSRILQNTLAHLIASPGASAVVGQARAAYGTRRGALRDALERRGVRVHSGPHGIVLWVEVRNETDALLGLASKGVVVGAGSKAFVVPPAQPLIRVSPLQLPDDPAAIEQLAGWIAEASRGSVREFFD